MKKMIARFMVVAVTLFLCTTVHARNLLAQGQAKKSQTQLTFTYNSPENPWTDAELTRLKNWVASVYPKLVTYYASPAESGTVNIKKDPTIAGGISTPTEITLGTFYFNDFIHEIVHTFSGTKGIFPATYREGMVEAVTALIMKDYPDTAFSDRNHGGQVAVMYEQANKESIGSVDGNFENGLSNRGLRYTQASKAWADILVQDPYFLAKFNPKYYAAQAKNPNLRFDLVALASIAKSIAPTVGGKPFDLWYSQQEVFDVNPARGLQLVYSAGDYAALVFVRNQDGMETMLPNVTVKWTAYDCWGTSLDGGVVVTDSLGWAKIPTWNMGATYSGKVNLRMNISVDGQTVDRTISLPSAINGIGIFGVAQSCQGAVTLTLPSGNIVNAPVISGAFSFSSVFQAGTYKIGSYLFTKDGPSNYFVYAP